MVIKSGSCSQISQAEPEIVCTPAVPQGDYTVAITSDKMGDETELVDPDQGTKSTDTAGDTAVSYAVL